MHRADAVSGIRAYVDSLPAVSDHDHHHPDRVLTQPVTLDFLLRNSYVAWQNQRLGASEAERRTFLDHARFNSYFAWMEKGISRVHGITTPITAENWDSLSDRIARAHAQDPGLHLSALRRHGYQRLILDTYWSPGEDNGHPEVFSPTFRIDQFLYGTHAESEGPNQIFPWTKYGFPGGTLEDWTALFRQTVRARVAAGKAVALKCAEAYFRTIDFLPDDLVAARRAWGRRLSTLDAETRLLFGNYIVNRACELAAELDIPFQIHTGLGRLSASQPVNLIGLIERHPKTRFVLFHAGFPWSHQVSGLIHNYPNALPNLTWMPLIATEASVRALHDFIDVAPSVNTITWGSDCWTAEESIGALLAWRWVVARVLAERLADGRLESVADAESLARKLMYENNRAVYRLIDRS
jgi:hypothetical protein